MKRTTILEINHLSIGYNYKLKDEKLIHKNINLKIAKGELISLLGPNGAGKSTLLRTLTLSQKAFDGQILYNGIDLNNLKNDLPKIISVVLTDKHYAGGLKVEEIVSLGRAPYTGFFGKLNREDKDIVSKSMSLTGISFKRNNYFADLSDGEKQKVMISKALAQQSEIIILDEPTSFLDITSKIEIMNLLRDLVKEENKTIILSTHDINQALQFSDKLILLNDKEEIKFGIPETLIINGDINRYFIHNNIHFNQETGHFYKLQKFKYEIKIVSYMKENYAINQLLNRHSICNGDCNKKLEFFSKDKIIYPDSDFIKEFKSIDDLDMFLSDNFK